MDIWTMPGCAMLGDAAALGAMRTSGDGASVGGRVTRSQNKPWEMELANCIRMNT
jgi:hypothetical protein